MINKSITYLTFNINRCPVHVTNHGFFLINSRNVTSWSFLRLPKKKNVYSVNSMISCHRNRQKLLQNVGYYTIIKSNQIYEIFVFWFYACLKLYTNCITVSQKILNFGQIQDNYVHIVSYSFLLRMNISIIYYIVEMIINVCILSSSHPEFHQRNNPRHFNVRILTIPVT